MTITGRAARVVALACVLLAGREGPAGVRAQAPSTPATASGALQRGLTLMETRGDCAAALPLFATAAASADATVAPRALYLSGQCHEQGANPAAARRSYEQLVARFPGTSLAAEARRRVARLRTPGPAAAPQPLTLRRLDITAVPPDGSVSRDGRYFASVDEQGQWARLDAESGILTPLVPVDEGGTPPWHVKLSPSGRQTALTRPDTRGHGDLVLATVGNGKPEVLIAAGDLQSIRPVAWSADARVLLVVTTDATFRVALALVDVTRREMTPLLGLSLSEPFGISMTSDGSRVLFDHEATAGQRDVRLLDVRSRDVVTVVSGAGNDVMPTWLPDDRAFLFASDRLGPLSLWRQEASGPGATGSATLVRRDIGRIWPMGMTSSGTFIHGLQTGMIDVHVARLGEPGRLAGEPSPVSTTWAGNNQAPDWSPDGTSVAYVSLRGAMATGAGMRALVIRDRSTGQERLLFPDMLFVNAPRWSHDGTRLVVKGRSAASNRWGTFIVDAKSGALSPLFTADAMNDEGEIGPHQWVPGREAILIGFHGKGLVEIDVATGAQTVIVPLAPGVGFTAGRGCAYAPDGRTLAYSVRERARGGVETVLRVRTPAGLARELLRERFVALMAWAPDGRSVYAVRQFAADPGGAPARDELWRVPVDGSSPTYTGLRAPSLRGVSIHPDGRTVAYVTGLPTWEIWAMEGIR